jgi:predicted XRE-type DNA-binding protein
LTQAQKAVTQPRISNLTRGKIISFGLDMLAKMATADRLRVSMKVKKAAQPGAQVSCFWRPGK